ncbi:hypothetical protein [Polluticaenibacter yanchengensis]|uniref:Uncharacterized protein n=1 Tax=Polluticaenibacter yanchengensis TaxID=3014562 RepID=A0ABT4UGJ1_9BACT|nr:hypothetical protein [Chitinophagaceae bacterium LY-5]
MHETAAQPREKNTKNTSVNYKCSCEDLYAQPVYQYSATIEIPVIPVKWINRTNTFADYQYAHKQYISSFLRGPPAIA